MIVISLDQPFDEENEELTILSQLESDINIEEEYILSEAKQELYNIIALLEEPYKTIMKLRCQNLTFCQIGEIINMKEATVYMYFTKGLNKMRYFFKKRKGDKK